MHAGPLRAPTGRATRGRASTRSNFTQFLQSLLNLYPYKLDNLFQLLKVFSSEQDDDDGGGEGAAKGGGDVGRGVTQGVLAETCLNLKPELPSSPADWKQD